MFYYLGGSRAEGCKLQGLAVVQSAGYCPENIIFPSLNGVLRKGWRDGKRRVVPQNLVERERNESEKQGWMMMVRNEGASAGDLVYQAATNGLLVHPTGLQKRIEPWSIEIPLGSKKVTSGSFRAVTVKGMLIWEPCYDIVDLVGDTAVAQCERAHIGEYHERCKDIPLGEEICDSLRDSTSSRWRSDRTEESSESARAWVDRNTRRQHCKVAGSLMSWTMCIKMLEGNSGIDNRVSKVVARKEECCLATVAAMGTPAVGWVSFLTLLPTRPPEAGRTLSQTGHLLRSLIHQQLKSSSGVVVDAKWPASYDGQLGGPK
ncbi:hypothetical protein B0H14DRAFT_2647003 [Mycena olivaceomarginata]|nr:hypothetical protein B0H14DRAFT_2647003 [Mycena olivaceomarginata]